MLGVTLISRAEAKPLSAPAVTNQTLSWGHTKQASSFPSQVSNSHLRGAKKKDARWENHERQPFTQGLLALMSTLLTLQSSHHGELSGTSARSPGPLGHLSWIERRHREGPAHGRCCCLEIMFSENLSLGVADIFSCFSCVQLFAIPWFVACQAPLSVGFSRQEY